MRYNMKVRKIEEEKKLTRFDGAVIFALAKAAKMDIMYVYRNGGCFNDTGFHPHDWQEKQGGDSYRHYPTPPVETMLTDEVRALTGITNIKSAQGGHKFYQNTLVGDVLVITYGDCRQNWTKAVLNGFIDTAKRFHLPTVEEWEIVDTTSTTWTIQGQDMAPYDLEQRDEFDKCKFNLPIYERKFLNRRLAAGAKFTSAKIQLSNHLSYMKSNKQMKRVA